jgi:ribosomal subunit interface protein
MIKHIDIAAAQKDYKVEKDLEKYIQKKIGKLDRHMKRKNREAARADVKLKESSKGKGGKKCTAEVILHTPDFKLTASESTINMHAAIDIVETKLQNQLKKEKEKRNPAKSKHVRANARKAIGKFFKK